MIALSDDVQAAVFTMLPRTRFMGWLHWKRVSLSMPLHLFVRILYRSSC